MPAKTVIPKGKSIPFYPQSVDNFRLFFVSVSNDNDCEGCTGYSPIDHIGYLLVSRSIYTIPLQRLQCSDSIFLLIETFCFVLTGGHNPCFLKPRRKYPSSKSVLTLDSDELALPYAILENSNPTKKEFASESSHPPFRGSSLTKSPEPTPICTSNLIWTTK